MLDFLDNNPQNTKQENLRALCFNCVYSLYYTLKGWYRHRDTAIRLAEKEARPTVPTVSEQSKPLPNSSETVDDARDRGNDDVTQDTENSDTLTYIPFEEFQKTLNN